MIEPKRKNYRQRKTTTYKNRKKYLDKFNVKEKCGESLAGSNSEIAKEYQKIC